MSLIITISSCVSAGITLISAAASSCIPPQISSNISATRRGVSRMPGRDKSSPIPSRIRRVPAAIFSKSIFDSELIGLGLSCHANGHKSSFSEGKQKRQKGQKKQKVLPFLPFLSFLLPSCSIQKSPGGHRENAPPVTAQSIACQIDESSGHYRRSIDEAQASVNIPFTPFPTRAGKN